MPASPCINICQMDPNKEFCLGCFRSLDEIANWACSDEQTQRDILAAVAIRRQKQEARNEQQAK